MVFVVSGFPDRINPPELAALLRSPRAPAAVVIEAWADDGDRDGSDLHCSQRISMSPARARKLVEQLNNAIANAELAAADPEART